ncbi:hypothetical protein AVEN_107785-1 [Araneus ventricosus]|uniref:Uncharacterized protein n=1 Tax=Araneus ventricosus TaxID=182803 RepID=A0A4Y2NVF4_ARAVE|nr:hypothetical protein AVEN_107785-1 [Araneus ventricosus]
MVESDITQYNATFNNELNLTLIQVTVKIRSHEPCRYMKDKSAKNSDSRLPDCNITNIVSLLAAFYRVLCQKFDEFSLWNKDTNRTCNEFECLQTAGEAAKGQQVSRRQHSSLASGLRLSLFLASPPG